MKFISNVGTDRVADLVRPWLNRDHMLDMVSSSLSLFAFSELLEDLLSLDRVKEEFLKLYVAYKAETNFVDIVPQAKRLLLVLNLSIDDIEDPKGLCRDISNIGRWGNGDVEIGLSNKDELPYVVGLIRQSFDHQMGGPQDL